MASYSSKSIELPTLEASFDAHGSQSERDLQNGVGRRGPSVDEPFL